MQQYRNLPWFLIQKSRNTAWKHMDDQVLVFKQSHVFKPIPLCQGYLKQTGCATWRFLLRLLGNILAGISGANSQIIPCPGPRNQSTPHEGTAQGFWSLCLLKRKARLFHPLHAIAILSHNQQNNLQTVWLLHTICLGKKSQGYAHLARWRQTQKGRKFPESHWLYMCFLSILLPMDWVPSTFAS